MTTPTQPESERLRPAPFLPLYSYWHLEAAAIFAGLASQEERKASPSGVPDRAVLRSHSIAAVMTSVSALETAFNDFMESARSGLGGNLGTARAARDRLVAAWDTIESRPVLRKYAWILEIADLPAMDRGAEPWQSASALVTLRNAIVHQRAEWSNDTAKADALEKGLAGRFQLNSLVPPNSLFIPDRCLAGGCARWAFHTSLDFLESFRSHIGLEPAWSGMLRDKLIEYAAA